MAQRTIGKKFSQLFYSSEKGTSIWKGEIVIPSDFPTLLEVKIGWEYTINNPAGVTDNDPTRTNTGQTFVDKQEIKWNGTDWTILGNERLWGYDAVDYFTIQPRNINLTTGKIYKINDENIFTRINSELLTTNKAVFGSINELDDRFKNGLQHPIGFSDISKSEIFYNPLNTPVVIDAELTLQPREIAIRPKAPATSFDYYLKRVYNITTPQVKVHTNDYGTYYLYWDKDNILQFTSTRWNLVTDVPISWVTYNLALIDGFANEDRHSSSRNPDAHNELHNQIGTYIVSGFSIGGSYTVAPVTPTDADNTYSLSLGVIADEDLLTSLPALPNGGPYTLLYRIGSAGRWYWDKTKTVPYFSGATYNQYNEFTGATWDLTELANNNYCNYYVFKVPSLNGSFQTVIVPSQKVHTTLAAAAGETVNEAIQWGVMPFEEIAPLYKVTFRTSAAYTTTGKCRIAREPERLVGTRVSITVATQLNHNSLSGLQEAAAGVTWGHITSGLQTIYGNKQFQGIIYGNIITSLTNGITFKNDLAQDVLFLHEDKSSTFYGSVDVSSTDFLKWASGTTAERPITPANGMVRYNSTTSRNEFYENGAWENYLTDTTENLWDRSVTTLSPHNAGDDVGLGAGDLSATDLYPSGIIRFTGSTVELRSGTAPGSPFAKVDPNFATGSIYFGRLALGSETGGSLNEGFGNYALDNLTTGINNLGVGYQAGTTIIDGQGNTTLGNSSDVSASDAFAQIAVGYNAVAGGDYVCQIGDTLPSGSKIGYLKYKSQKVSQESWIDTNSYFAYIDGAGNFVKGDQQLLTSSNVTFNQGYFSSYVQSAAVRIYDNILPAIGEGLEMQFSDILHEGFIGSYNRGSPAFQRTNFFGSILGFRINSFDADRMLLNLTGLGIGITPTELLHLNRPAAQSYKIMFSEADLDQFSIYYDSGSSPNKLHIRNESGTPANIMTFLQDGKVGINVDTPLAHIDVLSDNTAGIARFKSETGIANNRCDVMIDTTDADDQAVLRFSKQGAENWQICSRNELDAPYDRLIIYDAYDAQLTILRGGNVGFGITNPTAPIDVLSDNDTAIARFKSETGIASTAASVIIDTTDADDQSILQLSKSGTTQWFLCSRNEFDAPNNRFCIYDGSSERFTILDLTGYVGIAIDDPTAQCHIVQDNSITGPAVLKLDQSNTSRGFADFVGDDLGVVDDSSEHGVMVELNGMPYALRLHALPT